MQTKSRISSPHPASAGELPAASLLCSLFSIIHSHSSFNFRKKNVYLKCPFQASFPLYFSTCLFLIPSAACSPFFLRLFSLHFLFVYPPRHVPRSFFSVHMLLELNGGGVKRERRWQLNPPPEGASVSLLPLVHDLALSL